MAVLKTSLGGIRKQVRSWCYLTGVKGSPRISEEVPQPVEGPLHQRRDAREDVDVTHADLAEMMGHVISWEDVRRLGRPCVIDVCVSANRKCPFVYFFTPVVSAEQLMLQPQLTEITPEQDGTERTSCDREA